MTGDTADPAGSDTKRPSEFGRAFSRSYDIIEEIVASLVTVQIRLTLIDVFKDQQTIRTPEVFK